MKGTLKNKHETDVNESIILALVYKDDSVKLHINIYNISFWGPSYHEVPKLYLS
jgi:hypothetical protein